VDWRMMVALAAFAVSVTASLCWFGEKGRPLHRAYAAEAGTVAGELVDVITNMWSVKAFSARDREIARLAERFGTEAAMQTRSWMYTEKARVIHDVSLWVLSGGMLAWATHLWLAGAITPGDVVVVSALTFRILHSSRDLALAVVDAAQQIGFIEDTLRVIAQPPVVVDRPGAPVLEREGGTIDFREADFTYPTGLRAIKKMNLFIPAGQKIGIVGPSGAGKSTMIHLVQRLFDVDSGEIVINGQPVGAVQQDTLRDVLAVVPQEVNLFHRSVAENIRFARPDATAEEVIEAGRAASCDGFVRRLNDGYDTVVGERGATLSGGQRQRIGIARAFLKNAAIVILDEATSALDTESEIAIREALLDRMRDRTVVAVSHRLSMLAGFDRVIVLNDGPS
jgi:ATP-binding cassette, subfamily B, bacterial